MANSEIRTRILDGFDDPSLSPTEWNDLLGRSNSAVVFMTWEWQRAWWDSFGRGQLLLIAADRDDETVALAPLFYDSGMIYFVGSGGSDYLDFIGEIESAPILEKILRCAADSIPDLLGFVFYHVPDFSPTGQLLGVAGERLGLECYDEGELLAPTLLIENEPEHALAATRKKSLRRHENYFRREGQLEVFHTSDGVEISSYLPDFFDQHIVRWSDTEHPSLFTDEKQRDFYVRVTETAGDQGWLRFTVLKWNQEPIAYHFGSCYRGRYLWYKPSFALNLSRRSPGEVLLRQLLLAAIDEGAEEFDFGLGQEAFKDRFANHVRHVRSWGLYPK